MATLRPTTRPIVRMGMRARRSPSMRSTSSLSRLVRVLRGLELRSARPSSPIASNRFLHFLAVRRLIPADSAAALRPTSAMRAISNLRPSYVVLAFLWLFIRSDPLVSLKRQELQSPRTFRVNNLLRHEI